MRPPERGCESHLILLDDPGIADGGGTDANAAGDDVAVAVHVATKVAHASKSAGLLGQTVDFESEQDD